ncbi:MAG: sodium-translocating pyrophosphatase, partial [Candidatus Altiarchaeales archaeon]|nr:sodium-translocating pyrophosphatase [Candidatus Altiarchaeales archaeon]
SPGNEEMKRLSGLIHQGALTFLNSEYRILVVFISVVFLLLLGAGLTTDVMKWESAVVFVVGAVCSAFTGNIGMRIATASNARTTQAAKESVAKGLKIAFSSGLTMGLAVVGLGVLGITVMYYFFKDPMILYGFGFGASSIALFARVGGGIYTKGADVGADLVGKVEAGIPEDDPRNPAVIADNVGDNVGDVAGMGADLFESYSDSIIAAMAIGAAGLVFDSTAVTLPLIIASIGIFASILGSFYVHQSGSEKIHGLMDKGIVIAAVLMVIGSFLYITGFAGQVIVGERVLDNFKLFVAVVCGLAAGLVIGYSTEYYTSDSKPPAKSVAESAREGAAINIITGLAVSMKSTVAPILSVSAAIIVAYWAAGIYGIALAAVGMLSTLGITLASDSYGPVADNAAGIAEMAGIGGEVRERAEALDAIGNTTAAIGKGFAIGSAALTSLALFTAYAETTQLEFINLMDHKVIVGLFIGGLLPFLFSSYTMSAVGEAASEMVEEVRRQFKDIPGLMNGKAQADYTSCIDISTKAALKQMIFPSLLAVITPILMGLILGKAALAGLLAGSIVTGFLLAVMMANAGGMWDNAKKYVEKGNLGGKGSPTHAATVVGDTVGDPFKDTAGPSLNILIKLVSIVALVFAPLF